MKKLITIALLITGCGLVYATTSTKGETAQPVFTHRYTYE